MSSIPSDIRHLPVDDRITLVEELWDSIAADQAAIGLTEAQQAELDRRIAARAGRDAASPWLDVRRRMLGREILGQ
jgi:putative addiction module component (TIGR02574 family)